MKTLILSLGGSLVVPSQIDTSYLKKIKNLLYLLPYRFILVCGGGAVCREYQTAAKQISKPSNKDLDWLGIASTKLNAELVRLVFGRDAYEKVAVVPTKKIKTKKKFIIASGWKPGCSSDLDAVLWAKTFNAKYIFNLTNINGVYTADPKKDKKAKLLETVSWKQYRTLISATWKPGLNTPFDPTASRKAQQLKISVSIIKGTDLNNLKKALLGKKFKGTEIF